MGFLGVLAASAAIMQFYISRMFLEANKAVREKRNKKITGTPQSTSGAVLRAGPGGKKKGGYENEQKTSIPPTSLTHRVSFFLLLARHMRLPKSFCCPLHNSAKRTCLGQIWDSKE